MPKMIVNSFTPDQMQAEVLFTRSALEADPTASDLLSLTDNWSKTLDDAISLREAVRVAESKAQANVQVAAATLCDEVRSFAGTLLGAAKGSRTSTLFVKYFPMSPSDLIRGSRRVLVQQVNGWLAQFSDPALEQHREALSTWAAKLEESVLALDALRGLRIQRDEDYAKVCNQLTSDRRVLHATLSTRATEQDLGSRWPDRFFRIG